MIIQPTVFSALVGGAGTPESMAFDDAAGDLNAQHSINKIECSTGWVVDGIRVTYATQEGLERQIIHGTFKESKVENQIVKVAADEYISKVEGEHGHPNGDYDYGDCIQKIRFGITNSKTKAERFTEYFGLAQYLKNPQPFSWEGRLFAFAGRADNSLGEVGLKGLSFGQLAGKVVLAESIPYGGDRSHGLMGQPYNDLESFGDRLDFKSPIKSIAVWSGQVVDGLEVTYSFSDGTTKTVMHGAKGGGKTDVALLATERIVEVNGLYGNPAPLTDWGTQVQLLTFTIFNSANGTFRNTATFGAPNENFAQETRKDICVRGPLVGFAGVANNSVKMAGLNTVIFYTQCPV